MSPGPTRGANLPCRFAHCALPSSIPSHPRFCEVGRGRHVLENKLDLVQHGQPTMFAGGLVVQNRRPIPPIAFADGWINLAVSSRGCLRSGPSSVALIVGNKPFLHCSSYTTNEVSLHGGRHCSNFTRSSTALFGSMGETLPFLDPPEGKIDQQEAGGPSDALRRRTKQEIRMIFKMTLDGLGVTATAESRHGQW
jgi:hypothetical protein